MYVIIFPTNESSRSELQRRVADHLVALNIRWAQGECPTNKGEMWGTGWIVDPVTRRLRRFSHSLIDTIRTCRERDLDTITASSWLKERGDDATI